MSPIQQMLLGAGGAVATKTYVDDVFSTFLYTGTGSSKTVTTGIDQSGEGSLTWIKKRNGAVNHQLFDTVRGAGKAIYSDGNQQEYTNTLRLSAFTPTGFTLGSNGAVNASGDDYSSWTFRKAPGFFDVVTYTGTGTTAQNISHNLGSVPGLIITKKTSSAGDWLVYHKSKGKDYAAYLHGTNAFYSTASWDNTEPTSTNFRVKHGDTNDNGQTYVAYVFAGGESTAATARSVDFDGSNDGLQFQTTSSDFEMGSSDFTVETWLYPTDTSTTNINKFYTAGSSFQMYWKNEQIWVYGYDGSSSGPLTDFTGLGTVARNQWSHVALTRSGNTFRLFINGVIKKEATASFTYSGLASINPSIGMYHTGTQFFKGKISNFRVVKGTAVYTSSFRPPTEPLTNITNTKLLCCNNSSVTGNTVSPSTITAVDSPTASTDSPFDDPAGFSFGDAGDQNVIKCGSYVAAAGAENINLGFEPQWVMVKCTDNSTAHSNWHIYDSMRGVVSGGNDAALSANLGASESDTYNYYSSNNDLIEFTPTGFKADPQGLNFTVNGSQNNNYIYMAIRRPDGYVGKPPELGTGVFGLGTRSGSSSNALSNVNVFTDFSIIKRYNNGGEYWATNARLTGKYSLQTNSTDGQLTGALPTSGGVWDYMAGHLVAASNGATNTGSDIIDYGWKRHAGFDVVAYTGNGIAGHQIPHSMNKVPEMLWVKNRDSSVDWAVWHKALNGGVNPEDYYQKLNNGDFLPTNDNTIWNDTAPTATHFTVGTNSTVNTDDDNYLAILFSSVKGVSHIGSYSGNNSGQTITIPDGGFQPRFIIIKVQYYESWYVYDTVRGWTQSLSLVPFLRLDITNAQSSHVNDQPQDVGYPTSTGFYLTGETSGSNYMGTNQTGRNYVYYAHA